MFIVFEGIDGSGKTTLSNRVAQRLRKMGYRVTHARENGELQSAVARRVRELTRDAGLFSMGAHAELFLNAAREGQQVYEVIRPALARGDVVIADRYVYSQLALSGAGRGMSVEALRPCVDLAAQGVWPELVVLIDVDPEIARARKRLARQLEARPDRTESRKGLAGAGLTRRVREGYLALARAEPARWRVLENDEVALAALEQRVMDLILARLEGLEEPSRWTPPQTERRGIVTVSRAASAFFERLDDLELREPSLGAYLVGGISGAAAHRRRLLWAERYPSVIARGLLGLGDPTSLALRRLLMRSAPRDVAISLSGERAEEAMVLRRQLLGEVPREVMLSLRGDDSPAAWALRQEVLDRGDIAAVLPGLAGLRSTLAWTLRGCAGERLSLELARSVAGVDGEEAEALRRRLVAAQPLAVLKSSSGLDGPWIRALRESLFPSAAKTVLRSLVGVDAPYAWRLRERAAPDTKEALDSLDGMGCEAAWRLRERYADRWTTTAISSMRELASTERGQALLDRLLAAHGHRLMVLRSACAVLSRAAGPARIEVVPSAQTPFTVLRPALTSET